MNNDFTLFVVDDAKPARWLVESAFTRECRVESFASAEECLEHLNQGGCVPGIFLLDVDMPGMDGYSLCRKLRERADLLDVPVIFVSGLDDIESRLEGYDAGGTDFIVKPCNLAELRQKVGNARCIHHKLRESEHLSSLILSNLDEYAVLIQFLRKINDCAHPRALVGELFDLLEAYQLQTAIQLRLPGLELTISDNGENQPLEVSVINHVRNMGRIFEFKSRAAYNFENITLLINNVPLHDPDLCGRIRDNVAIAVECTQAKLQALQTKAENAQARGGVADLLDTLRNEVQGFEKKYALARYRGSSLTMDMLNELTAAFAFLGMSDEQERKIVDIVHVKADELADIYDFGGEMQETLNKIAERLSDLLKSAPVTVGDHPSDTSVTMAESPAPSAGGVELF